MREHEAHRVVVEHVIHPQPGYPFRLELAVEYALGDGGLTVRITARNGGAEPCPYGCGQHPYLTLGTPVVDALELDAPAQAGRCVDGSWRTSPGPTYDFGAARAHRRRRSLDNAFTELERDGDGRAHVRLRDPATGARRRAVDGRVVPVPDALHRATPCPPFAGGALAVEPMTCPPNAFRTGESLIRLEPGESVTSSWGIVPAG